MKRVANLFPREQIEVTRVDVHILVTVKRPRQVPKLGFSRSEYHFSVLHSRRVSIACAFLNLDYKGKWKFTTESGNVVNASNRILDSNIFRMS